MTRVLHSLGAGTEFQDAILAYWLFVAALLLAILWVAVKLNNTEDDEE